MLEPRTCHLLASTMLFYIGIALFGADIVVTDVIETGRQQ